MDKNSTIDTLNELLRGELAATETYQQAIDKFEAEPQAVMLRRVHVEHRDTANMLRQHIHEHGGKPEQSSGAWGMFAKATEGTAKMFGETAALKALKEGEEHGLNSYESALRDENLPPDCKDLIAQLIPQTRAHITMLDQLMMA